LKLDEPLVSILKTQIEVSPLRSTECGGWPRRAGVWLEQLLLEDVKPVVRIYR